ncbi:hypothetical protein JCM3766R1_004950 [Sporobolomyces carnicolor]
MSSDRKAEPSPPPYAPSCPPAGLRVPCASSNAFPAAHIGGKSVHPCKVTNGKCMISYGGGEFEHHGRFDVLPITPEMEWVQGSYGQIPKGRRPVEGGFEENGSHLFHAVMSINGIQVPGKTGTHLHGANFPWNGGEQVEEGGYSILCWRD